MFSYNPVHQVVVCHVCKSCIIPGCSSQKRHLRAEPHRLSGAELSLELLSSYSPRTVEELREHKPRVEDQCQAIEHLACYGGFYCLQPECQYSTRHFREMRKHMPSVHQIKAAIHEKTALWKEVKLQTYFTRHGRIDYFVVTDNKENEGVSKQANDFVFLTQLKKDLFEEKLEKDYKDVNCNLEEQATVVQDIGDSRSERVPWLHDLTGFPTSYVRALDKKTAPPPAPQLQRESSGNDAWSEAPQQSIAPTFQSSLPVLVTCSGTNNGYSFV